MTSKNRSSNAMSSLAPVPSRAARKQTTEQQPTQEPAWLPHDVLNTMLLNMAMLAVGTLAPRKFSTGSVGYHHAGKATIPTTSGKLVRCQVSMSLVLIHSKPSDPKYVGDAMVSEFLASPAITLETLGLAGASLYPKTFKSGNVGWYANGKAHNGAYRFQVSCSVTAIPSK